ncbi:MAG TPA: DnaB-like helicase N-terminal domain-containing protein, partial [Candidatus Acidoferrum sp.]
MNVTTTPAALPELAKNSVAERDTLGAILFDPEKLGRAMKAGLVPEHFASPGNGRIFAAMLALQAEGKVVELTELADRLETDSEVGAIGGAVYIASLVDGQYRGAGFDAWVEKIRACWVLRRVSAGAESLGKAAEKPDNHYEPQAAVETVFAQARAFLADLSSAVMSADWWPEPKSLESALPSVQMLPMECLPVALRGLIEDIAERMQVPPDYPAAVAETPYPKKNYRLPTILSQEEVARLIDAAETPFHRTLLMTLYATGLRRAEVTHLKVSDVDSKRMVIHVRGG